MQTKAWLPLSRLFVRLEEIKKFKCITRILIWENEDHKDSNQIWVLDFIKDGLLKEQSGAIRKLMQCIYPLMCK